MNRLGLIVAAIAMCWVCGCTEHLGRLDSHLLNQDEKPDSVWSMWGGSAARTFRGISLSLSTVPRIIWKQEPLGNAIPIGAVANEEILILLGEPFDKDKPQTGPDRYFLVALRLSDGHQLWKREAEDLTYTFAEQIALDDGRLFIASVAGLKALDCRTGEVLWNRKETWTDESFSNCLKVHRSLIYVSFKSGEIKAFRQSDGTQVWESHSAKAGSPAFFRDRLVAKTVDDADIEAISLTNGRILWRKKLPAMFSWFKRIPVCETGSPAVSNGLAIITAIGTAWPPVRSRANVNVSSYVAALDLETGKLRWKSGLPSLGAYEVAVDSGRVYVGCYSGKVVCFDLRTGRRLWKTKPPQRKPVDPAKGSGWPYALPVVISGEVVIVGTRSGDLFGLSGKNGKVLWQMPISNRGMGLRDPILITGGYIIVINGPEIIALKPQVSANIGKPVTSANVAAERGKNTPAAVPVIDASKGPNDWHKSVNKAQKTLDGMATDLIAIAKDEKRPADDRIAAIRLLGKIGNWRALQFLVSNVSLKIEPLMGGGYIGAWRPCRQTLVEIGLTGAEAIFKTLRGRGTPKVSEEDMEHLAFVLRGIFRSGKAAKAAVDANVREGTEKAGKAAERMKQAIKKLEQKSK